MATETVITTRNRKTSQTQETLPTQLTLPTQKTQATPPTLTTLPTNMERTVQQQSFYSDYNDPYQLNSLADAILNTEAIKRASEGWGVFSWMGSVPMLRQLGAIVDVAYNTGIKPILKGDWKAAGVNTLMNLGETMDVLANPVKGLLMEGGSGFIKGLGYYSEEGRKNYDWDTGSWIADIGLELVSDPLNWISFGGKAAISAGAKTGAKETMSDVTEKLVKEAVQQLAEQGTKELTEETIQELTEQLSKKLAKSAQRTLVDISTEAIQEEAERAVKALAKKGIKSTVKKETQILLKERTNRLKNIIINELIKSVPDETKILLKNVDSKVFKTISKSIDSILTSLKWDSMTYGINKAVASLYNISEGFEKFLFKSVITTSGLGLGLKMLKPVFEMGSKFLNNTILRNLRKAKYIDKNNVINIFKYDNAKELYSQSYKLARTVDAKDVVRTKDVFYRWVYSQLNTDIVEMTRLHVGIKNTDTANAALENYIKTRYKGASLADYIAAVKKINESENGFFVRQVQELERLQKRIVNAPSKKLLGQTALRGSNLYTKEVLTQSAERLQKLTVTLEEINKIKNKQDKQHQLVTFLTDTEYMQFKEDELKIQLAVIYAPAVEKMFDDIFAGTEHTIGVTIKNIIDDTNIEDTFLRQWAIELQNTAIAVHHYKQFVDDILNTVYEDMPAGNTREFKNIVIDALYDFNSWRAQDIISNIDNFMAELRVRIETAYNANYKTVLKNRTRIYVPELNMQYLKEQILAYANTLSQTNPMIHFVYPINEDFLKTLNSFTEQLQKASNVKYLTVDKARQNMISIFKDTKTFQENAEIFSKDIFRKNKTIAAQYLEGTCDVMDTLMAGTEGLSAYSMRAVINTKGMQEFFTFVEGARYSAGVLEQATAFMSKIKYHTSKLKDDLIDSKLNKKMRKEIKYTLEGSVSAYQKAPMFVKAQFPNLAFLEYVKTSRLSTKQQFAVLQSLYQIAQESNEIFLRTQIAELSTGALFNLLEHPKVLQRSTLNYNPQNVLTDLGGVAYYDSLNQSVQEFSNLAQDSTRIYKNVKNRTEILKRTQDSASPLIRTNERYVRKAENVNNNIFRYVENKIRAMFDSDLAEHNMAIIYRAPVKNYKLSQYVQRFYNEDLLTDAEYKEMLDLIKNFKIVNSKYAPARNLEITAPFKQQLAFQQQLAQATDRHRQAMLTSFLTLSPDEMQKELAFRGRIVMFAKDSYAADKNMKAIYEQLKYKEADLNKLGVEILEDDQGFVIIILNKQQELKVLNGIYYLNGEPITRTFKTLDFAEFKDVDEHLYKEFQKIGDTLTDLTGHSPNTGFGDIMDEDLYGTIYNGFGKERLDTLEAQAKAKQTEIPQYYRGLPNQIKNKLPTLDELKQDGIFEQYLFNESILGSADQVRRIQAYTPNNIVKTIKNSMEQVGVHLQTKVEYIEGIMDSVFSIAEGTYKNFTDEEILEALVRNPRYRLVYLKEDPKWGMKVVEIPALNVKAVQEARRLKAVVLPQDVYVKMVNVVNHRLGGSGFFKLWNRVMYLYKMGYLFNPGTIARNWIDTNLKTDLELGTEARGFKRMARDYIRQYSEITDYIAKANDNLITRKGIEQFFENIHDGISIDKETFMMLDDFFRNGPVSDIADELRYSVKTAADGDLWRTFTYHTSKVMDWANQTEEVNRLALYLGDLNRGIYKHEAWEHIANTHFDYAFKTPFEQFTEAFLPFSTFTVRNINYWVDTLTKHPEFVGLFRDIYTPIWNFDDLTPEQLNSSWSLQYQIINGNINLFDINDTEYVARINPSIFDAFGAIVNPIQAIQNKLAAPIQTVAEMFTGEMPTTEDLPIIGTIQQRLTKAIDEKNILPSIITKRTQNAPRSTTWNNSNLNNYYGIANTSNPYYVLPKTRSDSRIDPLRTIGIRAFTSRYMSAPKVKVDVYNQVKWKYKQNVYGGIRYQLRLNVNKFR